MKKTLLLSALLATLTVTGCSTTAPVITQDYEFVGPNKTVVDAQIGEFQVPENRNDPNSRLIIIKFPTTSKNPRKPIVYLAGGPGGSATGENCSS